MGWEKILHFNGITPKYPILLLYSVLIQLCIASSFLILLNTSAETASRRIPSHPLTLKWNYPCDCSTSISCFILVFLILHSHCLPCTDSLPCSILRRSLSLIFSMHFQPSYSLLVCGNHSCSHSNAVPDTQAVCFPSPFRFYPLASTLIFCLSNAGPLGKVWNEGKNFVTGKVPACLPCYSHLLQILERHFPAYKYREGQCPFIRSPVLWSISYRCCWLILL